MDSIRLTIVGAGSIRCMPDVSATLALYFGERPLDIKLFDGDEERLDVYDRLCRLLFLFNRNDHSLSATDDLVEALHDADRVVMCAGTNCASAYLRKSRRAGVATGDNLGVVDQFVELVADAIPDRVEVLSLLGSRIALPLPRYRAVDWPQLLSPVERAAQPLNVLRLLNGEEYPLDLLQRNATSPLKQWLENVEAIAAVRGER
jgi:hypothetical protein